MKLFAYLYIFKPVIFYLKIIKQNLELKGFLYKSNWLKKSEISLINISVKYNR